MINVSVVRAWDANTCKASTHAHTHTAFTLAGQTNNSI